MSKILLLNIVFIWALTSTNCLSQSVNIVPPTPNAMKMTEYYAQRPNMYTGTANVTIPLYSINFDGWQLPLTLSYNATGIRTNEEASEVGLGWALNATGVISRTIQGGDDLFPGSAINGHKGYVYNDVAVTFSMGYDWKTDASPSISSYYYELAMQSPDTQPDIFNYNFFGYSGSFVLSQQVTSGAIQAIKVTEGASSILFDEPTQTFTVITPDGYRGEFTIKEKSTSFSGSTVAVDRMQCCSVSLIDITGVVNNSGRFRTTTTWYLSKITSPRGQVITFTYDLNADNSSSYLSNSRAFAELEGVESDDVCLQTVQEHVYLKNIVSEEVRVDFSMESREDLKKNNIYPSSIYFPQSPQFLKRYNGINITGLDTASTLNKTITLTQGYFNEQYHDLVSNNNNDNEFQWLRSRLDRVKIDEQEYQFYYEYGSKGIPNKLTTGIDHFGFYNGQDQVTQLLPPNPANGAFDGGGALVDIGDTTMVEYYKQTWERRVDFAYGKAGLLTKVSYPTRGYTVFEYEPHVYVPDTGAGVYFREENSTTQADGNAAGGARIKSMREYGFDNSLLLSKAYLYIENTNVVPPNPPSMTTGRLMTPLYNRYTQIFYDENPPFAPQDFNFLHRSHSSIPGNNSAEGKLIGYSKVNEVVTGTGGNYKNVYYFVNKPSKVLAFNSIAVGYPNLNGQAMEIRNYDSQGKIVQRTVNQDYNHPIDSIKAIVYERQPQSGPFLHYLIRHTIKRSFNTPYTVITTLASTPSGIVENNNGEIVTWGSVIQTRKDLSYNSSYLLKSEQAINSTGETIKTEFKRPPDYTAPSATRTYMLDKNIVAPVMEEITSRNGIVIAASGNRYEIQSSKVNLTASYSYNKGLGSFTGSSDGITFSTPYEKKIDYSLYDSQTGKLLEYTGSDGVTNSFIWGYNGTLPIVNGVGINYSQLNQAYTASIGSGNYESTLRNHPNVAGKYVTTFIHNPQVGVSRITDPSGVKKTYQYDQYSRLQKVMDNDGNTLEQYTYHFRERAPTKILSISGSLSFGTLTDDFFTQTFLPYAKCSDGFAKKAITISNTGEADLTVYSISVPAGFTSKWMGGVIPAGTSVVDSISFNSSGSLAFGNYGGVISVSSDKTEGVSDISASAVYADRICNFSVSPSSMNFGVTTGSIFNQSITVTNNGNATLRLGGVPLDWNGVSDNYPAFTHPDFQVAFGSNCIEPGQSISLPVSFIPLANGQSITKLSLIPDMCPAEHDIVTISGEKIPYGSSCLKVDPATLTMPQFTFTAFTTKTITVSNLSMFPVTVESVSSSNPMFTISPSSAFTLQGFGQQTFTITFTPTAYNFSEQSSTIVFDGEFDSGTISKTVTGQRTEVHSISLSPNQLNINGHGTGTATVTNTGNTILSLSGVKYAIPGGSYSSTSTSWSAGFAPVATPTLAPNQSTMMNIQSISSSSVMQNIQVQYNKPGPYNANDEVQVGALNRNISISAVTFASFTGPSVNANVTVSNTGNAVLTVNNNITSSNSKFAVSSTPPYTTPFTINPQSSVVMTITYTPTDFTLQSSNIVFASDDTDGSPGILTVSAQRVESRTVSLSPNQLSINGHGSGTTTVTNTGNTSLTLSGVKYAIPGGSYTSTSTSWSSAFSPVATPTLGPNQSTMLNIQSISSSSVTQNIQVQYNKTGAYNANDEVQVGALNRNISVSAVTFPSFTGASVNANVTVSNTGNSVLTISNITKSNPKFAVSSTPPYTLPITINPGSNKVMTITYTPTDFTLQSSSIVFASDATSGSGTLNVTAQRAQSYQVSVSPLSLVIKPSNQVGTSYITNTGNINAIINSVSNSNPSKFSVLVLRFQIATWVTASLPYTLTPGTQLKIEVRTATSGVYTSATGTVTVAPSQGPATIINVARSPTP